MELRQWWALGRLAGWAKTGQARPGEELAEAQLAGQVRLLEGQVVLSPQEAKCLTARRGQLQEPRLLERLRLHQHLCMSVPVVKGQSHEQR